MISSAVYCAIEFETSKKISIRSWRSLIYKNCNFYKLVDRLSVKIWKISNLVKFIKRSIPLTQEIF